MPEKLTIITGSIIAFLTTALGVFLRTTTVRKSEIYHKNGMPIYQHRSECKEAREACNKLICSKILEVKNNMSKMDSKLSEVHDAVISIKTKMDN